MMPANTFKIPSLDGIRALSFLIVFISHDQLEQVPGLFGIVVFFFLSGYLITTLMRMANLRRRFGSRTTKAIENSRAPKLRQWIDLQITPRDVA